MENFCKPLAVFNQYPNQTSFTFIFYSKSTMFDQIIL